MNQVQNLIPPPEKDQIHYLKSMTTEYTECYDHFGRFVLDHDAEDKFLNIVISNLN